MSLSDEEQLDQIKSFAKKYGSAMISGILIALIAFFGWEYWQKKKLSCLQSAMFLINSCSGLVSAAVVSSGSKFHHQQQRTFSRSYGTILPSSFSRVLSSALVYST